MEILELKNINWTSWNKSTFHLTPFQSCCVTWPLPTTLISLLSQERHRTFFLSLKYLEHVPIPRPFRAHSFCSKCSEGFLPLHPSVPSSQLKQHPRHSLPSYLNFIFFTGPSNAWSYAINLFIYLPCVSTPPSPPAHILIRGNYSILFTAGSEVPTGLASPCN